MLRARALRLLQPETEAVLLPLLLKAQGSLLFSGDREWVMLACIKKHEDLYLVHVRPLG